MPDFRIHLSGRKLDKGLTMRLKHILNSSFRHNGTPGIARVRNRGLLEVVGGGDYKKVEAALKGVPKIINYVLEKVEPYKS